MLSISVLAVIFLGYFRAHPQGEILGFQWCFGISPCPNTTVPPVTVSGFIRIKSITLTFHPEKRIPLSGNWDTVANIVMQNCSNSNTYSYSGIATNTSGTTTINIPLSSPIQNGNYRFFIKGFSHLNEEFNCYAITTTEPIIDLTPENKDLLAGEVSVIYDNHINALDMSVLIKQLFQSDYKTDLNQDSKVNSLDFSNQLYNIYKSGD